MKIIYKLSASILLFTSFFGNIAPFVAAAPIDSAEKYAWSDLTGWINFNPTNGNVEVTDTAITGSAWSENYGWIYLQPTTSGVENIVVDDPTLGCIGDLSGQAWNTHLGWLDFENVYINGSGSFIGTASGTLFGSVSFQGTNHGVETDWIPDCTVPATPITAPDLLSFSDTGNSDSDNLTSDQFPTFEVMCGEVGSTMTLYAGTGSVGTVLCSSVGTTNVSLSGSFLADGVYSFSYTETDTHGNTSGFSPAVSVILDYTIPEPATILSPENASLISDTSPTLTGTGTPGDMVFLSAILGGGGCQALIDGSGNWTCDISPGPLNDGDNMIIFNTVDPAGNIGDETPWIITVDAINPLDPSSPDLSSLSDSGSDDEDDITSNQLPGFELECSEVPSTLRLYSGTGVLAIHTCSATGSVIVSSNVLLAEGEHLINYTSTDLAGNTSSPSSNLSLIIDTSVPDIVITAPTKLDNSAINDTSFTISDTEGFDVASIVLGTGTLVTSALVCTPSSGVVTSVSCTVSIDTSGDFTIQVQDIAGNTGSDTETNYVVDTIAPLLPNISVDVSGGINNPTLTFSATDNIAVDYYEIVYTADDGGPGTGTLTTLSSATSPANLTLDSDELIHTIIVRVYDTAGNMSENTVKFPPLVNFIAPIILSNAPITNSSVTITNPTGNPLTNIVLDAGTTGASLGTCTGAGGDTTDPYDNPVTCSLDNIAASGIIKITADDSITGAQGENSQSYGVETSIPTITLTAPTKIYNTAITDTTLTVMDDTGILAAAINLTSSTASYSNLSCTQTSTTRVDCTLQVDGSGDISVGVTDMAGNTNTATEIGYMIELIAPVINMNPPVLVNSLNQTLYPVSGTCIPGDGNVSVIVLGASPETQSIACTPSGTWSTLVNVSALPDAEDIISISASQTDAAGNTGTALPILLDKDSTSPTNPSVILPSNGSPLRGTGEVGTIITVTNASGALLGSGTVQSDGTYSIILNPIPTTGTVIVTSTDGSGNTSNITLNATQLIPLSSSSSGGGGGGGASSRSKSDACNGNDTSGSIYDGKCTKDSISSSGSTLPKPIIDTKEEEEASVTEESQETKVLSETELISEQEGYMQREVNGKLVGYTLENTFEGCPIIDALNDADYKYRENFFPDTKTSIFPNMVDTFGTLKIAHGNVNGLFEPKREITRAEFTKMVLISHCYTYNEEDPNWLAYTDLDMSSWQARVISKAQKLEIISGYQDNTFKPNQLITKAEATKILMRMAFIQANTLEDMSYTDISVDWHKKYVQTGETLGVFDAKQDKQAFKPDQGVTREDMVDMIQRVVDLYR